MAEAYQEIHEAQRQFDINAPLSDEELVEFGMMATLPGPKLVKAQASLKEMPLLQDIEDVDDAPTDAVAEFENSQDYNRQYAHYLRCQALAALVAFEDGWRSFEELVLKAYVAERQREDKQYRGDDPNKAFSLRVRRQAAEDFVRFIRVMVHEAATTPKPSLAAKK